MTIFFQKMKFSNMDFFTECDQIRKKLLIWSNLLKKPLVENFIFCSVLNESVAGGPCFCHGLLQRFLNAVLSYEFLFLWLL